MTIETPYKRSITSVGQTMPFQIAVDMEKYALFALKTHMWEFLFDEELPVIRSMEIDNAMVYVVDIYKADIPQIISKKRERLIQSFVDRFTIIHPSNMFCKVYEYKDSDLEKVKNWVYPEQLTVKFEKGEVHVNLYNIPDYSLMYDQINISLYYTCNETE
jgi:hypothetical protein